MVWEGDGEVRRDRRVVKPEQMTGCWSGSGGVLVTVGVLAKETANAR